MNYDIENDIKVTCCSAILVKGEIVKFIDKTSPNRVRVKRSNGQYHKVRFSTLRSNSQVMS